MTDDRFFHRDGPFALDALAHHIGAEMPANAPEKFMVRGVGTLEGAGAGELSVFSESLHREAFQKSHASVVITSANLGKHALNGTWLLLTDNPRLAFAQIGHLFYPQDALLSGAHASASIDPSAKIGAGTEIGAGAVIHARVKIGARCLIGSNAVVGDGVMIGDDCSIGANTSISHAMIGSRVRIGTNVSIGGEGFGFVAGPSGVLRVPQLGRAVIEDGVEIGDNCAIDRGTMNDTVIGMGTAIDNLVQIAHNVRIGKYCVIAGQAGVAGSATIGDFVMIGGAVAISDHVTIGSHARIAGRAGVMRDVAAKQTVAGTPAVPVREWHRQTLALEKMTSKKPQ
jgi:UDP-3-O-[3-hydroxymyristoyl] glucosamine N-acyltransferase